MHGKKTKLNFQPSKKENIKAFRDDNAMDGQGWAWAWIDHEL